MHEKKYGWFLDWLQERRAGRVLSQRDFSGIVCLERTESKNGPLELILRLAAEELGKKLSNCVKRFGWLMHYTFSALIFDEPERPGITGRTAFVIALSTRRWRCTSSFTAPQPQTRLTADLRGCPRIYTSKPEAKGRNY